MFIDRPIGIDLGTTNSEVAILDPSERDLIVYADKFGRKTIPSAVAWDERSKSFLVGRSARNKRGSTPGPIESIKRRMGRDIEVEVGPHRLKPEEISAKILEELRGCMLSHLQKGVPEDVDVRVHQAVITVPAYFDAPQVEATRKAGELAGLTVLGVLQEPTAAAIYHTWRHALGDGNFLIYDLGGGTFDVSILKCLGGEYQVHAIDGDNFLGGDDFDRRYAESLRKQLVEQGYSLDFNIADNTEHAQRFQRLIHLAQEIKESLSTSQVVNISKQNFMEDNDGEPVSFEGEIGRDQYNEVIAEFVEKTIACCRRALERSKEVAGIGLADLNHIVLVGGSTRVPLVVEQVTAQLCAKSKAKEPLQDEVDTCVALGAAVHAAQLGGLRLGDDSCEVAFLSPLVCNKPELKLDIKVEKAPDGVSEVAICSDAKSLTQIPLSEIPSEKKRLIVPMGEESERELTLELRATSGSSLGTLPFSAYRRDLNPRATSLSNPTVLAKDISVEVIRAGKRQRKVLLARGSGLPAEVSHRFYTADQSGAVVLRILQNRLPIKTLVVKVEDLAVGTPVDVTLKCDATMRLEARALVAEQELWAQIEPAKLTPPKSAEAVDALLTEAEEIVKGLWGQDAKAFQRELEPLATGLREAISTDPDKAADLAARLQLLVEEFKDSSGSGMSPPMHRFVWVMDRLRKIVFRNQGGMLGMSMQQWEERIADIEQRGQRAFDNADAGEWKRCYNESQALVETASEREFAARDVNDPAMLAARLLGLQNWSERLMADLRDFVPGNDAEVREMQQAEQAKLAEALTQTILPSLKALDASSPKLRSELDRLGGELSRIESACERLSQLGLVSERGGSPD